MTTIPCDECNGKGFVEGEECTRIRCIGGQIELTEEEVKAIEAEQANVRT